MSFEVGESTMFGTAIRYMATKPKPKMKPIELKTPPEQTQTITRVIFDIVKEHGPLTIGDTWDRVKVLSSSSFLSLLYDSFVLIVKSIIMCLYKFEGY